MGHDDAQPCEDVSPNVAGLVEAIKMRTGKNFRTTSGNLYLGSVSGWNLTS